MTKPAVENLPAETASAIAGNVALVAEKLLADQGIAADAWEDAVAYLGEFIERQRQRDDLTDTRRLESVVGSYLGEAAAQLYGGRWVLTESGQIGVDIDGLIAFPFAKTAKQFANGPEDSIVSFLRTIPAIQAQSKKGDGQ